LIPLFLAAAGSLVLAGVPHTMNYQGRLTDSGMPPSPVNGTLPMVFGIWDAPGGGNLLWSETWGGVAISEGVFSLILGSTSPIPSTVFSPGVTRWLEITVDGVTLSPRQQISSASWSYLAEGSDALGGVPAAGWQKRITGSCPPESSIRSVDEDGNVVCETDDAGAGGAGIPSGAVMFFNLAVCPAGWTELAAARGRYLVGQLPGGTLGGTVGTALVNLESRAVGLHSHSITDPGHAHSYVPPIQTGTGSGASSAKVGSATSTSSSTTGISVNNAGSVAGTNAPYVQLLVCQKD
jgi:hypothetical protein